MGARCFALKIRSTNIEIRNNIQTSNAKNERSFRILNLGHWLLFRYSNFRIRISESATRIRSHLKPFAEIELAADRIVDEEVFRAFALDPALENQIRAINDRQRFTDIVVGNNNG